MIREGNKQILATQSQFPQINPLRPTTKVLKILDCLTRMNLEIETMIIHESYNPSAQTHDIALLKVNTYTYTYTYTYT